MSCHICTYYTAKNGCEHYEPSIKPMNQRPLPPQKVYFNSQRLIVLTHRRKDLTTSEKALKWYKIKQFQKTIFK